MIIPLGPECLNDWTWPYHGMSPCAMKMRTSVLNKFWKDHISDKYGLGGDTSPYVLPPFGAVPKPTFSFAMAVMDKVEGWNTEKWVGSYLAASMWTNTKPVLCDGCKPLDLQPILATIVESVSWVTEDSLWDHEWITETKGHHERKSHSGATSLRHRHTMPSSMGIAMVFSTDKPQSQVREQRDKSGQIQGHSQKCNRVNV